MMKTIFNLISLVALGLAAAIVPGCNTSDGTEQESDLPRIKAPLNDVVNISDFAESIRVIRLSNDSILRDIEKLW